MKIPNFFIVGAPKCGTTALSEYLRHHPNVFFSDPKELNYFIDEKTPVIVGGVHVLSDIHDYLKYFSEANENQMAVGEGTPLYLYSDTAIRNILDFNPEARLIVMVRNPVDMVYALHTMRVYAGYEHIVDFEEAWRKQDGQRSGRSIHKFHTWYRYSEMGMLGRELERVFSIAPAEQVKVIIFDDFVHSPRVTYEEVLAFLGLPSDGRTEFQQINPSKRERSRTLQRGFWRVSDGTIRVKRALGIRRGLGILKWLNERNMKPEPRPPLSASFEYELREYFREDIELLSRLIDRDLSPWLRGERLTEGVPNSRQ
jgi:hypothetical protein